MEHCGPGLTVKHQVEPREGGITEERCCQAPEEAAVALAAVDAPQGCIDALITVSPTLQKEDRVSDGTGLVAYADFMSHTSQATKALVHIWLALRTKVSYLNVFDSKSDDTPRADTSAHYTEP